ncbi:synaptotagmin-15 isoform X1 [Hydra vulgaris]|uniref:Synaptotagmin-15 n=2 Tax=Hydra vulgaris TaxID=6087 RepID=T2M6Q9_HYDVU|nr:synaptotagmin-15 isoform X1 [Hydra vulgaris]
MTKFLTDQMYGLGGVLIGLFAFLILCTTLWFFYWRKQQGKRFRRLSETESSQQIIQTKFPIIKTNTLEFTLPQTAFTRSLQSSEKLNESNCNGEKYELSINGLQDTGVIKTKFGQFKPALYQSSDDSECDADNDLPPGNNGRIYFNLEYLAQSEKLVVTVDRIRNLLGRNASASQSTTCDPFIRLYLLPDEKRYLQSKMKRKTRHPVFKETFIYTMSYSLLIERTLRITVFDVDRFMRQNIIGHALYPLSDLDVTMVTEVSRDVEKFSQVCAGSGRLQIGLTHFPDLNRISVNVIRASQLFEELGVSAPDTYVKITYLVLSKVHKIKKTSIIKSSFEPLYNETMEFKINSNELDAGCLHFEVFQCTGGIKNDRILGYFIIGGNMCSRGKELEHWENMVQNSHKVIKEWHDLKS